LTKDELINAYGGEKMNKIIEDLESKGVNVHHGIDATKLDSYEVLNEKRFDRIIFNFPCIPG